MVSALIVIIFAIVIFVLLQITKSKGLKEVYRYLGATVPAGLYVLGYIDTGVVNSILVVICFLGFPLISVTKKRDRNESKFH